MAAANAGRSGTTGCDHRNPASRTAIEPVPPGCWEKRKESILMRVFGASAIGATAVIALLAGPVHAQQMPNINLIPELGSKSPREAARTKARDFLNRYPKAAYMSSVESWRELPDGAIEFTMRRLASAD